VKAVVIRIDADDVHFSPPDSLDWLRANDNRYETRDPLGERLCEDRTDESLAEARFVGYLLIERRKEGRKDGREV
jgi:hypothetical protein